MMASYTVTYGCGHTATVKLFGPGKDRDRKLAWMREADCPACFRAGKEAEGPKAYAGFLAMADGHGHPGHVIALIDARPVKDQLKARGYRFAPDGGARSFFAEIVGGRDVPEWRRVFPSTEHGRALMAAEIADLVSLGLVSTDNVVHQTASDALAEAAWAASWAASQRAEQSKAAAVKIARLSAARPARVRPRVLPRPYDGEPIKVTDLGLLGSTVGLPANSDVMEDFRRRFPRARYNPHNKVWGVPGKMAARRLTVWATRIMDGDTLIQRQRLIDGAAWDGINSRYVTLGEGECVIDTPYDATIVSICKGLGGRWDAAAGVWRIDGSMLAEVIKAAPRIDALAKAAAKTRERSF